MDILGVYEPHFKALFSGLIHVCSRANAHPQNPTGKSHPKPSNLEKKVRSNSKRNLLFWTPTVSYEAPTLLNDDTQPTGMLASMSLIG